LAARGRGYNKVMRASAATALLFVLALASSMASSGALPPNVIGTFVRSGQVVACYPSEPCDPPPQAAFLLFTRNGRSTRVRPGAAGTFAVRLQSGVYRVSVLPGHSSSVSPAMVRVPRVGVVHVRLVERATPTPP
jgi:hypothetical protein